MIKATLTDLRHELINLQHGGCRVSSGRYDTAQHLLDIVVIVCNFKHGLPVICATLCLRVNDRQADLAMREHDELIRVANRGSITPPSFNTHSIIGNMFPVIPDSVKK